MSTEVFLISTHHICFCGEIRKISVAVIKKKKKKTLFKAMVYHWL